MLNYVVATELEGMKVTQHPRFTENSHRCRNYTTVLVVNYGISNTIVLEIP